MKLMVEFLILDPYLEGTISPAPASFDSKLEPCQWMAIDVRTGSVLSGAHLGLAVPSMGQAQASLTLRPGFRVFFPHF